MTPKESLLTKLDVPFPLKGPPVKPVDGVISVSGVVHLNKAIPILERDLPDAAVLPEQLLYVPLPGAVGDPAHVDAGVRHHERPKVEDKGQK